MAKGREEVINYGNVILERSQGWLGEAIESSERDPIVVVATPG